MVQNSRQVEVPTRCQPSMQTPGACRPESGRRALGSGGGAPTRTLRLPPAVLKSRRRAEIARARALVVVSAYLGGWRQTGLVHVLCDAAFCCGKARNRYEGVHA